MLKDCSRSLKGEMPLVGLSMRLMIINNGWQNSFKVMRCHLCYKTHVLYNPRTKLRKGLISYHKTNGILTFKKTCGFKAWFTCKKT
jgi:hypothetical protein